MAPEMIEPSIEPFEVQQMVDLLNESRKQLMRFLSTIEDESILAKKISDASSSWRITS